MGRFRLRLRRRTVETAREVGQIGETLRGEEIPFHIVRCNTQVFRVLHDLPGSQPGAFCSTATLLRRLVLSFFLLKPLLAKRYHASQADTHEQDGARFGDGNGDKTIAELVAKAESLDLQTDSQVTVIVIQRRQAIGRTSCKQNLQPLLAWLNPIVRWLPLRRSPVSWYEVNCVSFRKIQLLLHP